MKKVTFDILILDMVCSKNPFVYSTCFMHIVTFNIVRDNVITIHSICIYTITYYLIISLSESEFLQNLVKDKKIHEARAFNFTYRYTDDVLSTSE
jgi:hypothetical protein